MPVFRLQIINDRNEVVKFQAGGELETDLIKDFGDAIIEQLKMNVSEELSLLNTRKGVLTAINNSFDESMTDALKSAVMRLKQKTISVV